MSLYWFPIDKVPPPDNIAVLTWDGHERKIDIYVEGESKNLEMQDLVNSLEDAGYCPGYIRVEPTHWTYLPPPPKE